MMVDNRKNRITYDQPTIFESFQNLVAVQSNRNGGFSKQPYQSMNLGLNTEDEKSMVEKNRKRFFEHLGIESSSVAFSHQVHGDKLLKVDKPLRSAGYDALMTDKPGVFLSVTVADCTPVLIYHPEGGAVAAIHAGWRGTFAEIVIKTMQAFEKTYNIQAQDCLAYVGTCISLGAYEVGNEVADKFKNAFKKWNDKTQKYHLDLKAANKSQLLEVGIPESQIEVSPFCTYLNNVDYFSYRKEKGKTGRMLAVIGRKQ